MHPSERTRHLLLFCSDPRTVIVPFFAAGVFCVLAGFFLMPSDRATGLYLTLFSLAMFGAALFAKVIAGFVLKRPDYEVNTECPVPREELLPRAEKELTQADPRLHAGVNGNWIDVYLSTPAYTKMIEIEDDYTYRELDVTRSCRRSAGTFGFSLGKSFSAGHTRNYSRRAAADGEIHESGSETLNRTVHKWLADCGYTFRV